MFVTKRDGSREKVSFDQITTRINSLCEGLDTRFVDPGELAQKVISGLVSGVTTSQLDHQTADTAAAMTTKHPDYATLAARLVVSDLHKRTKPTFTAAMEMLYEHRDPKRGTHAPLISWNLLCLARDYEDQINERLDPLRDFTFSYFGFKTLERSYLIRADDKVVERPGYMLMRVALAVHGRDLERAFRMYDSMSLGLYIHASPTLFHAGQDEGQLSSCFLIPMRNDSIRGIYDTLADCALVSKRAGGVGLHIHNIRATGSKIFSTNGISNGLVPMLKVFNATSAYVDQGGNKRPGAFAIYLEPWHADIFDFLDLGKKTGKEARRARDLFYALWIPDLFMKRVEADGDWTLFCPNEAPGLPDVWGDEFEALYTRYEREGLGRGTIKAQKLWNHIMEVQIETGQPYMLYKDACNRKSNQQSLGTIKSSNLCTEIVEYTKPGEIAVCNLASIALPKFVTQDRKSFDFAGLHTAAYEVARNLDRVIDINHAPVPEASASNKAHRPVGMGVQGLADVFLMMHLPFDSPEAQELNQKIFETIYHGALTASCDMAAESGPYSTYQGSPVSKGILQYDMWNVTPTDLWDWAALKADIAKHGVRNSLLVAPMPTASTSQILGNNECFEAMQSNLYVRRTAAGEFQVVNHHLIRDLTELNLWTPEMKSRIIAANGSVQGIEEIPADLRKIYRTAWEIPQKAVIDMAAARGAFIDQSQSLNIYMAEPNFRKLTSMHFYGWKKGLKTGMYYLRMRTAVDAVKFTVDATLTRRETTSDGTATPTTNITTKIGGENGSDDPQQQEEDQLTEAEICSRDNKDACLACSS